MKQYLELLEKIMKDGTDGPDRTGTGTRSIFGHQMRFNLAAGFPLVMTRKIFFRGVVVELVWFLSGSTNTEWLNEQGVTIWNQWADDGGDLGPMYGKQWREGNGRWDVQLDAMVNTRDQIAELIAGLRSRPHSRRQIVSAWNLDDLPDESLSPQQNVARGKMALAPCHVLFQCYVAAGRLSLQVYQRSADVPVGVPYNIAEYALLTHLLAAQCRLQVGELVWTGGDCHVYKDQLALVDEQLRRAPRELPQLVLKRKPGTIFGYMPEDVELEGYRPHPAMKYPVSV